MLKRDPMQPDGCKLIVIKNLCVKEKRAIKFLYFLLFSYYFNFILFLHFNEQRK